MSLLVNDILKLKTKIEKLNKNQTVEIFKIVYKNGDKFTQNKNGIFLDINTLNEQSINEIRAFIDFTEDKGKHINEIEAKIKENIISSIENNNKFADKTINEYQIVVSSDYSPFVTDIDDNFLNDTIDRIDETPINNNTTVEDLNELIDEEDDDEEYTVEEDTISVSQNNTKKKKNAGLRFRILKKCKNINVSNLETDEYEKDVNEDLDLQELQLEVEII